MTRWQADPDLSGLRERGALDRMSSCERKAWLALWGYVAVHKHGGAGE
jgi:hypothetical protein